MFRVSFADGSSRQAYHHVARGAVDQRVELSQDRIQAVADMAIAAVDLALRQAGELPAQEEKANTIKPRHRADQRAPAGNGRSAR